ncbi:hypothetical protein DFH27DRAFT_655303 [Peziza echinospora]|nr:hypothetical protein DFH27DRAFT_655303 [Peziza echinospora]
MPPPHPAPPLLPTPPTHPTPTPLFGGALTSHIPPIFHDASLIRPVPSSQEVFVLSPPPTTTTSPTPTPTSDISIVIDLLQRVPADSDVAACLAHFEDVVDSSPSSGAAAEGCVLGVSEVEVPPGARWRGGDVGDGEGEEGGGEEGCGKAYLLTGTVAQDTQEDAGQWKPYTAIQMLIVRLPKQFGTDVVVSVNCPVAGGEEAAGREGRVWHPEFGRGGPEGGVVGGEGAGGEEDGWGLAVRVMEVVGGSLGIVDWDLFSPED